MSESPEEQPSTGVLGRIGSWFSPWRGKGPNSPTENASPTNNQAAISQKEEEGEESVRPRAKEQQGEEEKKEQSSNTNPLGLLRDIFPSEEEDATQSARRDGSVVSSTETAEGGPRGEEFVGSRKKRTGQGQEREETSSSSSNGTSAGGNPEKNASHLTHLSSEQGVVWDSDRAHTQPQAQRQVQARTGKRLHVYLEETSVIKCGSDGRAGQEVVRTEVTKSLKVLTKAKSSPSFDLTKSSSSASAENKRADVRPTVGTQSYYSAAVGVSLKSRKDTQSEPDQEQTEADSMGRKNAARKKFKKHTQGDGANSPQEKMSPSSEPPPEGFPISDNSVTSPQVKSPKSHKGESSINSSSKHTPTSQASPEVKESKTSCPDTVKQLDKFQETNSVGAVTVACVVDGAADMEDDDSLYKVERKTETPESKRRSVKLSRSEVKLFTKNVPLRQSPAGGNQDFQAKDEAKDMPKTEVDARLHDLKKVDEEPKPVLGRIADKISLFERPAGAVNKQTFQTPRSADVSPVRKATDRLKSEFALSDQRSKSAERYEKARSSSASPNRERPMTIKERARNFIEASKSDSKVVLPPKPAMTGMSQKSTSSVAVAASESPELDNQGRLDSKEQMPTKAISEITFKPEGRDITAAAGQTSIPKEQTTDSNSKVTVASKTEDQAMKPDGIEASDPAKETGDTAELADSSQLSKGPSRTGSRSKRRKSREPTSPIGPNSENKPDRSTGNTEVNAIKQDQVDDTKGTISASKKLTENVSLPSDKAKEGTSDEQSLSDKQKAVNKQQDVSDKQKTEVKSSSEKESISKPVNRQEPEPSVNRDEPDTAAHSHGTKTPIDKAAVILPQKEEKAGGHSPLLTEETVKASKDGNETPASSPSPVVKQSTEKQQLPAKHPKLEKELSTQSELKSKGKVEEATKKDTVKSQQPQHKDTELMNQSESKDVGKTDKVERKKTNRPELKDKEAPQQLLGSHENTTEVKVSERGQSISGPEESVARIDERKKDEKKEKARPVKDKRKPETSQAEPASESSSSDLPAQTQHVRQASTTHTEKAAVCADTQTNEDAASGTVSDKGLSKGETAKNGPADLKTKPTESPQTDSVVIGAGPQPDSGSVEKTENTPDDSCAHGVNDAELSSAKPITKATTAVGEAAVKARNDTPVATTALADSVAEKGLSAKEPTQIPGSESVNTEGVRQGDEKKTSAVKSAPSEVTVSRDIVKLTPQGDASKNTGSTSDSASLKGPEKMAHLPADSTASSAIASVAEKTAEKTLHSALNELSPVANGDISPQSHLPTAKKELVNKKPSQTPKAPASLEANKPLPNSTQRSPMRKLQLPRGLSKDDSLALRDAPSSWLDVDFSPKQKPKVLKPKLSSAVSESDLLETSGELDDDDFIEKIKNLCAPFSLPPRKHNPLKPPQPPFALPAIKEDRFEKTFDPEEFKFGLRKKDKFSIDTTPSILAKLQSTDLKSGLKPARASVTDRSMLLSSLDTHSRLKDQAPVKDEGEVREDKDDQIRVKSRLQGSCVFSSLASSIRGKRSGVQKQEGGTNSEEVSPSEAPRLSPPLSEPPPQSPTATAPHRDMLAKQSSAPSNREEAQAAEAVVSDSGPPLPSFNDIKLPDYLEKYLPQKPAKPAQSTQGQEPVKSEVIGKMSTSGDETEALQPRPLLPDATPPSFPGIPPPTHPTLHELKQPPAQPQGILGKHIRIAKGFHKRPGKMVLFEKAQFSGQVYEVHRDVADATALQLSPLISAKVVRGCWILYEKPDFQGRTIALEEGGIELTNVWAEPEHEPGLGPESKPHSNPPMVIGSIRHAVWDYSIPHIDLFTEPEGRGRVTPYHDDTIETGSFGIPLSTASIQVHCGVWLVFSDPGFQGMIAVLEAGEYPVPEAWGFPSPFVGSLRPLKMGGFKVESPCEVKAVAYEKPGFEGSHVEIDSDVFGFCESEGGISAEGADLDSKKLKSVGSLKIIGGLWVGYSEPGFEGQQHILEEGEYLDCRGWGGSEQLLSLRPVLADFLTPHLKMFSDRDFGELGLNIDLSVPVINMEDTGYGMKTQSIDVMGGVWVVFDEPGFCGEPYILEKGLYGSPEDWGALQPKVASAMPVVLDDFENTAKFKVQLFSEPGFQGSVLALEDSVASLEDGFSVASCKVLAGSWLAFEGQDFAGRMYVLEVGSYSDLRAMGCVNASSSILSLQPVGFEFSLPSITLFERRDLRGKRVIVTDGSVNLQLAGGCSRVQSVLVEGGIWVLYEGINYRGAQILLKPGEVCDWHKLSCWQKIGSLRPLLQKQVHFRLRNRQTGLMMSVTGDLDDVKLMRIQETEETDGFEQIWFYHCGHLHCKLMEECCLGPSGSVTMAGSRVGLSPEPNHVQLWSITPEGFIRYTATSDLVLEVKGGHHYDKNLVILNTLDPNKLQQRWNVEII
ncbi:uncharacterized protein AB9X84_002820 isoform 2-T2 [Acanthopagrus schlegelii]